MRNGVAKGFPEAPYYMIDYFDRLLLKTLNQVFMFVYK